MKILDAMTLRDGGPTCVSFEELGAVRYITFDFALPWDGRMRYTYLSDMKFGRLESDRLEPYSLDEIRIIKEIQTATVEQFGGSVVEAFLENLDTNPGEGMWFYVFNFIRLAATERDAR